MKYKSTTTQLKLFMPSSKPWLPRAYMKKAVKFLLEHAAAALFLDPGLGKTSITLAALKILLKKGVISKILIIAPKSVCHNVWPNEVQKWTDFNHLRLVVLHGKDKEELLQTDADIYLINPEGLDWLLNVTKTISPKTGRVSVDIDLKRWRALGFDTLIIDELTKFKNHSSQRFKAMKQVVGTFGRRWGLTGSPAANGLEHLFAQCFMLDQGHTFGPYITAYRKEYFNHDYSGFGWVLKEGADERIYKRVKPLALRMADEDYLDMPKLIENFIKVKLPPEALRVYLELERDMVAKIGSNKVTAATAGTASGKCRQIANGGIIIDQEVKALITLPKSAREWVNLHDAKTDALEDLVAELQGSPLLVAYEFHHDLDRLQQRFGEDLPYIGGGVSEKRSQELQRLWNQGKLPILAGQPQSIAWGLNLQEAGYHVAWYGLTWDGELYDQLIRRVRRQGQRAKRVYVHHIMASGTIDDLVLLTLKGKDRSQKAFFKALKTLKR